MTVSTKPRKLHLFIYLFLFAGWDRKPLHTHTGSSHFAEESVSFASGSLCVRQMNLPEVQVHYSITRMNTNNELVERGRYFPPYKGVSSSGDLWACQRYPAHILTVLHEHVNNPSTSCNLLVYFAKPSSSIVFQS